MAVLLVVFLCTIVSVSAGGVYCAKTARARAAALGLPYPGVHGAPDLYGSVQHRNPPGPHLHGNYDPELAETEPYMVYYRQNHPWERLLDDRAYRQAQPWSSESTFQLSHGTYKPVQSEYASKQVLSIPRKLVSNHQYTLKEVKHIAPPTWAEAPGQHGFVNWNRQGLAKPPAYREHKFAVESVPNGQATSMSGLPLLQSRGHSMYHGTQSGYDLDRDVSVFGSSHLTNGRPVGAMINQSPVFARWERVRFPGHLAQPLQSRLDVKHFAQGKPPSS